MKSRFSINFAKLEEKYNYIKSYENNVIFINSNNCDERIEEVIQKILEIEKTIKDDVMEINKKLFLQNENLPIVEKIFIIEFNKHKFLEINVIKLNDPNPIITKIFIQIITILILLNFFYFFMKQIKLKFII